MKVQGSDFFSGHRTNDQMLKNRSWKKMGFVGIFSLKPQVNVKDFIE